MIYVALLLMVIGAAGSLLYIAGLQMQLEQYKLWHARNMVARSFLRELSKSSVGDSSYDARYASVLTNMALKVCYDEEIQKKN